MSTSGNWFIHGLNHGPLLSFEIEFPSILKFVIFIILSSENVHAISILGILLDTSRMTSSWAWNTIWLADSWNLLPRVRFKFISKDVINSLTKRETTKNNHRVIIDNAWVFISCHWEICLIVILCSWLQEGPLVLTEVKAVHLQVFWLALSTTTEKVHLSLEYDRALMTHSWGLSSICLNQLPFRVSLVFALSVDELLKLVQVDAPQVIKMSYTDVFASEDIKQSFMREWGMIASSFWLDALKTKLPPVWFKNILLLLFHDYLWSLLNILGCTSTHIWSNCFLGRLILVILFLLFIDSYAWALLLLTGLHLFLLFSY